MFCHSRDFGILKAQVKPSQKSPENSHEAWVIIIMRDGSVMTAQHTTHAWLGKFLNILYCLCHYVHFSIGEACSHVAALLFKLKAACRLGYTNP